MSAEKCGNGVLTLEMVQAAAKKAALQGLELPLKVFSFKAYTILQRIWGKYPSFEPSCEAEIWLKAHQMGLINEE